MFDILDAVLERARARGAADVEVFGESSTSRRIKVYRQEVEQLTAAQRRGVGVRVFSGGAVGHAYTSDLSDSALDEVVQRALDNAAVSDPDEYSVLPQPGGEPADVHPYDPRLAAVTDEQRIAVALEVEAAALAADPESRPSRTPCTSTATARSSSPARPACAAASAPASATRFAYVLAEQEDQVETGYSYRRRPRPSRTSTRPSWGARGGRACLRACSARASAPR